MAKKTVKKWKSKLPVADKVVYWVLFVLIFVVYFAAMFGLIWLSKHIAFRDLEVVAVRERASVLLCLPASITTMLLMFIPWAICYYNNKRIIGGQWLKRKPKFQPQKPFCTERSNPEYLAKKAKEKAERKRKERWGKFLLGSVLVSLVLMIFVPAFFSPWGRDALEKDGGLKRYNMFNSVRREYDPEEITSVELYCGTVKSGKYSRRWTVFMRYTYADGRDYSFSSRNFQGNWLPKMTALKEQFDPSVVTCSDINELSNVIWDQNLDDEETAMLYALFDIQK